MAQEKFFLGRQPILDRNQQIIGFELLFRSAESVNFAMISDSFQASASVIINALTDFGTREILGRHKGFFNVDMEMLMSDSLELLPRDQVVIELLETINVCDEVIGRCRKLKEQGFTIALDDHEYDPAFETLYGVTDIVKVDILQTPPETIRETLRQLKSRPIALLAEKVETAEQYAFCVAEGFDLFQGYYFAHPVILKQKRVDIAQLTLTKLLEQVIREADLREIEETFKENPNLTYNLLRLVNSVAIGLREHIKTLRHALMVLGLQQLKRWIVLALYASKGDQGVSNPLLEIAAARGKLMELLVKKQPAAHLTADFSDRAFMTGILSMVDCLFEVSMEEMVQQLNLDSDIRLALLKREGVLGAILQLTEIIEQVDFRSANELMSRTNLTPDHLLEAQLETFNWSSSLTDMV
ncbi:HDOD domain-containing protein [Geotalea sp. SG265]|uniref:EAL and HDOD domain-containing protein n=1 Tax=Geotalea sp. SG265 TaxID=2922867 RepID=UPI001FAEFFBF